MTVSGLPSIIKVGEWCLIIQSFENKTSLNFQEVYLMWQTRWILRGSRKRLSDMLWKVSTTTRTCSTPPCSLLRWRKYHQQILSTHTKEVWYLRYPFSLLKSLFPVCHLLKSGVDAIFGPESGTTSSTVQSICDAMEIPHIETRWDIVRKKRRSSINLMPSPKIISKVGS